MDSDSADKVMLAKCCICCKSTRLTKSPAVLMPFVADRVFGHKPLEILTEWGMRDLRPGMVYTVCNSLQCQNCGVLFLDFRFSDAQMAALYNGYRDQRYTQQREYYEPGYAARSVQMFTHRAAYIQGVEQWLHKHVPKRPIIIDWGGNTGINTPFLKSASLIHVHDISNAPLVDGVMRADPKQFGTLQYDLLICSQVLEHVPFPYDFIIEMLPVITEKTLVYIDVPAEGLIRDNPGNFSLAPLKHHWHEHVNFFTEQSLIALLSRCGLQTIDNCMIPMDSDEGKRAAYCILAKKAVVRSEARESDRS